MIAIFSFFVNIDVQDHTTHSMCVCMCACVLGCSFIVCLDFLDVFIWEKCVLIIFFPLFMKAYQMTMIPVVWTETTVHQILSMNLARPQWKTFVRRRLCLCHTLHTLSRRICQSLWAAKMSHLEGERIGWSFRMNTSSTRPANDKMMNS